MTKLKDLLAENMRRFGTKNLTEQDKYQTLGQKGEIPMLDPVADTAHSDSVLSRLEQDYMQIKPKRVDVTEFKNDIRDLISIYKDKSASERNQYFKAFFDLYPHTQTYSGWKGVHRDIINSLNHLLTHAKRVSQGDTSNYGYRVHAWQKEKGIQ